MSYNGKWDLSPNALFCMIFRLFKRFPYLSYRKKPPLSSAFNPHEHELLAQSQPGERPAAAGGSRPTRRKPNDRRNAGERKPMKCRIKSQTDFGRRLVNRAFGAASAGGNGLPRQGGAVTSGKIKRPGHEAGERKPMKCRIKSQTDFGRRLVNRAFGAASAGGTACRGRGEPSHPAKSNDPATRPERGNR